MAGLRRDFYGNAGDSSLGSSTGDGPRQEARRPAATRLPFRFVGEEDDDDLPVHPANAADEAAPGSSPGAADDAAGEERIAIHTALTTYGDHSVIPHLAELLAPADASLSHVSSLAPSRSLKPASRSLSIPLTARMFLWRGCCTCPMNLVGITVDGVPVAAVVNRVFVSGLKSVSYGFNFRGTRFLVEDGATVAAGLSRRALHQRLASRHTSRRTQSSPPSRHVSRQAGGSRILIRVPARGAGNKLYGACGGPRPGGRRTAGPRRWRRRRCHMLC